LPNRTNGSKDNWGQTRDRQQTDRQTDRQTTDNRQQTTDNRQQTTDNRQTDIFELTPIHMGIFFVFFVFFVFCLWGGENKWGEIYTSVLATQVCFAHLLRLQGDKLLTCKAHTSFFSYLSQKY
jgi:hypothetical protein